MSSALEIILVVLVVALFFGAGRLSGVTRDIGRTVGRFTRPARAPAEGAADPRPHRLAALPRPPAAG